MEVFLILIFLISLVLLPLGLIKPSLLKPITRKVLSRKKIGLIFGGLVIGSVILGAVTSPASREGYKAGSQAGNNQEAKVDIKEPKKVDYEIVSYENNKLVENYWLLIITEDKSKASLEAFARNFKKEKCKKDCNISLYDDKKAAELDLEYKKLTSSYPTKEQMDAWDKKNYVYVADHFVGYLVFDGDLYNEYPYKDSHYKELTTK